MGADGVKWAHLDAIYFGNRCEDAARAGFDDGYIYRQLSMERAERAIPSEQLLREEADESFRLWEVSPFKKPQPSESEADFYNVKENRIIRANINGQLGISWQTDNYVLATTLNSAFERSPVVH